MARATCEATETARQVTPVCNVCPGSILDPEVGGDYCSYVKDRGKKAGEGGGGSGKAVKDGREGQKEEEGEE